METFNFSCTVQVEAHTKIKANSYAEAVEEAKNRGFILNSFHKADKSDHKWLIMDKDIMPQEIKGQRIAPPTRIVKDSILVATEYGYREKYLCDNGEYYTTADIAKITGKGSFSVTYSMRKYGLFSPKVFAKKKASLKPKKRKTMAIESIKIGTWEAANL